MKLLPLSKGKFAQVDDEDYDWLMQWKWHLESRGRYSYASRHKTVAPGKRTSVKMHREIMKVTDPKILIDHKNHDCHDNRKENLRICDKRTNGKNRTGYGVSLFLGVTLSKQKYTIKSGEKRISIHWRAHLRKSDGKDVFLGYHKTEEEAARAYDAGAKIYHGEFANLNFKDE